MLRWRFLTALALAPVVLAAIFFGGFWAITVGVIFAVALASYELAEALRPLPLPAAFGAGALPVALAVPFGLTGVLAGTLLALPWALFWLTGKSDARTLRAVLALLLLALWVGAPLAHLPLIEAELPNGSLLVLVAVVGPWISDAGAYFAGRFLGRHKLFPSLSPKKTVEGGVGGLLLTAAAIGYFGHAFLGLDVVAAALAGAAVSVFSQAGDLFESILKRLLDIKDLGKVLPGHGGILDRVDSLLFTAPAVYYLYALVTL